MPRSPVRPLPLPYKRPHGAVSQTKRRSLWLPSALSPKRAQAYAGNVETLAFRAKLIIEPATKRNDTSPDFRVFHVTAAFISEIGAAWMKTSKQGAQYLSVSLDDPSFPERINCRLVKTGAEHGHTLLWERTRPRD